MSKIIQKLVSLGVDLSTKKALKAALRILGIKPENIDKLYIELKNDMSREAFKKIHPKDKIIFIPQCLRKPKCKAQLTRLGYRCAACSGDCKANKIKSRGEGLGYRVFIVPGGSMVMNITKKLKPKAVLGIACVKELIAALDELKTPGQAVELLKDGCINTDVNLEEVFDVMDGRFKALKERRE
jgi:hypothetical protein